MPAVVTLPVTDPALRSFAQNMSSKLSAAPTSYGCDTTDAENLAAATGDYVAALALCDPAIRSHPAVVDKNSKKLTLKILIKQLALKIQGTPAVTDKQKVELGLSIPSGRTRIGPPAFAPAVDVVSVSGRTVSLKIHDSQESRRGKPANCKGAIVFSQVGSEPTTDPGAWKADGITTSGKFQIVFPPSVAPGAQVWVTARWYNARGQLGPSALLISTYLQGGAEVSRQIPSQTPAVKLIAA